MTTPTTTQEELCEATATATYAGVPSHTVVRRWGDLTESEDSVSSEDDGAGMLGSVDCSLPSSEDEFDGAGSEGGGFVSSSEEDEFDGAGSGGGAGSAGSAVSACALVSSDDEDSVSSTSQSCSVCYIKLTIEITVSTPCNHLFCRDCFFKWLKESKTCPMCRLNYVDYSNWDYESINIEKTTHEFNMFRSVIARTKDVLTEYCSKKQMLKRQISNMNSIIKANRKHLSHARNSSLRSIEDLEYRKGYYKACHFPITELDMYNYIHESDETKHWKHGFTNGFHEKYKFYISEKTTNIVDPYVCHARKHLNALYVDREITSNEYDHYKNNLVEMIKLLGKKLNSSRFSKLFKHGVLKNGTIIGMPYKCFKSDVNSRLLVIRNIYVEFKWIKENNCFYKLPYYKDKYNETHYFDYAVKLNKQANDGTHDYNTIFKTDEQSDANLEVKQLVCGLVDKIAEEVTGARAESVE